MLIDIVDEDDNVIGQKGKDEAHRDGDMHRVSHVWVINSKKELLCHKRADCKNIFPGKWDVIVGGHLEAGEGYEDAALREVEEEIGIRFSEDDMIFLGKWKGEFRYNGSEIKEISKSFMIAYDGGIETMRMNIDEISELKFISIDELKTISKDPEKSKNFITFKTFNEFIEKLFNLNCF